MKKANRVRFTANEGVVLEDLADVQRVGTQRAWEFPGYADLLSAWPVASNYATSFNNPANAYADKLVFTKGAGIIPAELAGPIITLGNGFIGIRNSTALPVQQEPAGSDPAMTWGIIDSATTDCSVNLVSLLPTVGLKKYILIRAQVVEADANSVTRHSKDAVTGVMSSSSINKRVSRSFTFDAQGGTPSATPTVPTLAAGYALVAVILVNDVAVESIIDCTVPYGPLVISAPPVTMQAIRPVNFTFETYGRLTSTAGSGSVDVLCPLPGDQQARLIAVHVRCNLQIGDSLNIGRYDNGNFVVLENFTVPAHFAAGMNNFLFTFLSKAIDPGSVLTAREPVWGHGQRAKAFVIGDPRDSLALRAITVGAGSQVDAVKWYMAKG